MRTQENPSSIANFKEAATETAGTIKARGFTTIIITQRTANGETLVAKA